MQTGSHACLHTNLSEAALPTRPGRMWGLTNAVRVVRSTALKTDPSEAVTATPKALRPMTDRKKAAFTMLSSLERHSMANESAQFSCTPPAQGIEQWKPDGMPQAKCLRRHAT